MRKELTAIRAGHGQTVQRQLLLSHAAHAERRARGRVAAVARAVLRGATASISSGDSRGRRARAVHRRGGRCCSRSSSRRVVSFHFGLPAAGPRCAECKTLGVQDPSPRPRPSTRRAGSKPRGVDAIIAQGSRGGRSPRHVSLERRQHPARHVRARAAGREGGQSARDRRRRHCRRRRRRGRDGARRGRRAGGHGLSALPGSHDERRASPGAQERRRARHRAHQPVHRPAGARHRQSLDAGARADQRPRARVSARDRGDCAAARESRGAGQGRLLAALVRAERERLQGNSRRRAHAGARQGTDLWIRPRTARRN